MADFEFGVGLQTPESDSIWSYLSRIDSSEAEVFRGAFAYVTEGGVDKIEEGLPQALGATTHQWLVSFDYGYSQPNAVRRLHEFGEVRVPGVGRMLERDSLNPEPRFHPKLVWIDEGDKHHLMIGSSNLTKSALTRNWESVVLLRSIGENNPSIDSVSDWWADVWEEGTPLDDELLDWYEDQRSDTTVEVDARAEDHSVRENAPTPRDASVVWGHLGYTQGGARNQMDIPTKFGPFFLEEGDQWEVNSEYNVTFIYEGDKIENRLVKFHEGSYQTRIYLPTVTDGTKLKDLFSDDEYDEGSLRYFFAVFRRLGPYRFKLKILPPEDRSKIREEIDESQQRNQVEETDDDPMRLVGWL